MEIFQESDGYFVYSNGECIASFDLDNYSVVENLLNVFNIELSYTDGTEE